MIGQARTDMVNRATAVQRTNSYVEGTDEENPQPAPEPNTGNSESTIHETLGEGMLLVIIAAELVLAFLIGLVIRMLTDDDPTAWRKLKKIKKSIIELDERISELTLLPQLAKKYCSAGILRAQNGRSRRHPPYHRAITPILILVVLSALPARAQTITRYEGILIDTSKSISHGHQSNSLFQAYLVAVRKLLLTEPPNTRVWVSVISADSFGRSAVILKGWTPEAHGVFTDDLNRARKDLASAFERKSSEMTPDESATDITGALWQMKATFEGGGGSNQFVLRTVWIFSDMMNDNNVLPVPKLLHLGTGEMLRRAGTNGLIVPLQAYEIHVLGASTTGLTPDKWLEVRQFWNQYFVLTGADLISYSAELQIQR